MNLASLQTPCLVLDRPTLLKNLRTMAEAAARHGVTLRPHMKTAKSIDVLRLAATPAITVSTLAEAEYFAAHGVQDILYAVGITPQKLGRVAALNQAGANVIVITDDPATAAIIAAHPTPIRAMAEVDSGEHRGGSTPTGERLLAVGAALGPRLAGVLTHGGHSYAGRTPADMAAIAEAERTSVTTAAQRLRAAGHVVPIVSMGSSPTAIYAHSLDGVTELRAGVYMFGDLFQASIGTHTRQDIAVTVLTSVIGRRPEDHQLLIDAGGIALSKDRSTQTTDDMGFGLVLDAAGRPTLGRATIRHAYQEHGIVDCDPTLPFPDFPIGTQLRVAPNHTCMTAAAHNRYYVVDGTDQIAAEWPRVNGW